MNNLKKVLLGVGVLLTGGYFLKMQRTSTNLVTEVKTKIHSLKLSGMTIHVDAKMKNPTDGTLKIKYPFVKLIFKNTLLGSSQVIDQDIVIPAFGEASINGVAITIPLTGLFSLAMELFNALKNQGGVKVVVKVVTTIYTTFSTLPYEYEIEQTLKQ